MRPHRKEALDRQRESVLDHLERWFEGAMSLLGMLWLALLIVEFTRGLDPMLAWAGTVIWAVFVFDFALRFFVAPRKGLFLKKNVIPLVSLALPAVRVLRFAQLARTLKIGRAAGGIRLFRLVASINRGMRALSAVMGRRGLRYVLATTLVVTLTGAAGMYAFEREVAAPRGLTDYSTALWWTAMIMTTMGSEYWPQTPEGRLLGLFLAIYAFSIFGYITAALASFFVSQEARTNRGDLAGAASVRALREEIKALRAEIHALSSARPGE